MMRYLMLCSLAVLGVAAFSCNSASAQTLSGQNPSGSAVSPYLNLMRPGTLPAINYYDLVQPQLQFQNAISRLQSSQAALFQGVIASGAQGGDALVMTGHPVVFGNYSRYFPGGVYGGGSGGGGSFAGQRTLQNQRSMYSPMRGLGGVGSGMGIGGMNTGGTTPGVSSPR